MGPFSSAVRDHQNKLRARELSKSSQTTLTNSIMGDSFSLVCNDSAVKGCNKTFGINADDVFVGVKGKGFALVKCGHPLDQSSASLNTSLNFSHFPL